MVAINKQFLPESKVSILMANYGFRYYDPVTGRWPSRDPIAEHAFSVLNIDLITAISSPDRGSQVLYQADGGATGEGLFYDLRASHELYLYSFLGNSPNDEIDYLGMTPTGESFSGSYLDYSNSSDEVWDAIGGNLGPLLKGSNSCAARVSYTLNKIGSSMPNSPRDYINTVKRGETGVAGNYIVNARKLKGYLADAWGTKSDCSETAAYYFKSSAGDIAALRKEIDKIVKKCNCSKKYAAVVTSLGASGASVSGHIGMVTPDYADQYTPYSADTYVWILPPTKSAQE